MEGFRVIGSVMRIDVWWEGRGTWKCGEDEWKMGGVVKWCLACVVVSQRAWEVWW